MRTSLWAIPATLLLVAVVGCKSSPKVKVNPDGTASEVPTETYQKPAEVAPAATTPVEDPAAAAPAPVVTPAPAAKPAPAPVVVQEKPAPAPVAEEAPAKHTGKHTGKHEGKHEASGKAGQPGGTWTVQKGDTLQSISKRVYGTTKKWKAIVKANPDINPDKIKVGQKLNLPAK